MVKVVAPVTKEKIVKKRIAETPLSAVPAKKAKAAEIVEAPRRGRPPKAAVVEAAPVKRAKVAPVVETPVKKAKAKIAEPVAPVKKAKAVAPVAPVSTKKGKAAVAVEAPKRRGRPPGSTNKPKPVVVAAPVRKSKGI